MYRAGSNHHTVRNHKFTLSKKKKKEREREKTERKDCIDNP